MPRVDSGGIMKAGDDNMLHNEARELLVQGYEATHDAKEIAKAYSVSKWTVYRLAEQKRKTGSVALRTSQRGRKPVLTAEDRENIQHCIDESPGIAILPTLRPGDIVVMDNMRSHHVKAVREILEAKGMKVLYLPLYSPDRNPIEKMWSKMNAILHCWKIRSLGLLPDATQKALSCVSPMDCSHWFAASVFC